MNRIVLKRLETEPTPKLKEEMRMETPIIREKYNIYMWYLYGDNIESATIKIVTAKFNPEIPSRLSAFLAVLSHEYMHHILFKNINKQASVMFDGIDI